MLEHSLAINSVGKLSMRRLSYMFFDINEEQLYKQGIV